MRIVAPMPQEGGPRIPQNPIFLKIGKNHQKRKTQKRLEICQNQRYALDQRSLIHPEAWFPGGPRIPQNSITNPLFFTNSALWAELVQQSQSLFIYLFVCPLSMRFFLGSDHRAPTEPGKRILQRGRIYRMVLCLDTAT